MLHVQRYFTFKIEGYVTGAAVTGVFCLSSISVPLARTVVQL